MDSTVAIAAGSSRPIASDCLNMSEKSTLAPAVHRRSVALAALARKEQGHKTLLNKSVGS